MHSDDPIRRRAAGRPFSEIVEEVNLNRRGVLKAGAGAAALAFLGIPSLLKPTAAFAAGPGFPSLPFAPFPADPAARPGSIGDTVRVADG
jgi:hypothetical protein